MRGATVTNKIKVITPNGLEGQIEKIDITELGYLRVTVYIINDRRWISYIWTDGLQSLLNGANLKLNAPAVV